MTGLKRELSISSEKLLAQSKTCSVAKNVNYMCIM